MHGSCDDQNGFYERVGGGGGVANEKVMWFH